MSSVKGNNLPKFSDIEVTSIALLESDNMFPLIGTDINTFYQSKIIEAFSSKT